MNCPQESFWILKDAPGDILCIPYCQQISWKEPDQQVLSVYAKPETFYSLVPQSSIVVQRNIKNISMSHSSTCWHDRLLLRTHTLQVILSQCNNLQLEILPPTNTSEIHHSNMPRFIHESLPVIIHAEPLKESVRPHVIIGRNCRIGLVSRCRARCVCVCVCGCECGSEQGDSLIEAQNSPLRLKTRAGRNRQSSVAKITLNGMDSDKKSSILREGFLVKRVRHFCEIQNKTKAVKYRFDWVSRR